MATKKRSGAAIAEKIASVQVKRMALAKLHTPEHNNRTITDSALQALGRSLTQFGLIQFPVVNVRKGRNVIVSGNQRVKALLAAGETHAPCVIVELDEGIEEVATFTLNSRAIQGEFVPTLLKDVMERIRANVGEGADELFKGLRFDTLLRSVMRNLSESEETTTGRVREGRVADDDVPTLGRSVTDSKAGRYYKLGNHVIYCGKLAEPGTLKGFGIAKADMAFSRLVQPEPFRDSYLDVYLGHTLKNVEGAIYLATTLDHLAQVQSRFIALGGHWSNTLISYDAKRGGHKEQVYRDVAIPVLYGWREGAKHFFYGGRDKSNLIQLTGTPPKSDTPVETIVQAIQCSARADAVILDAHIVQGSTLIAAEKTGRKLIGYVQSPRELDSVRNRWTKFVYGEKADWRKKTGEVK